MWQCSHSVTIYFVRKSIWLAYAICNHFRALWPFREIALRRLAKVHTCIVQRISFWHFPAHMKSIYRLFEVNESFWLEIPRWNAIQLNWKLHWKPNNSICEFQLNSSIFNSIHVNYKTVEVLHSTDILNCISSCAFRKKTLSFWTKKKQTKLKNKKNV